jgi:transposase-like protein
MKDNMLLEEAQTALLSNSAFLKDLVGKSLQNILEEEFISQIGAGPYQRTEERRGYRNGSYSRQVKTRVGSLELVVPRDRDGDFSTELFDRFQRSEKALTLSLVEMYLQGVSTRKVGNIVEELCGHKVSKSQVSELTKKLDSDLEAWRRRPLTKSYAYIIVDALYEKVRQGGRVVSRANLVAMGVAKDGYREIIGCRTANTENGPEWKEFLRSLIDRGLNSPSLVVSDDHAGLTEAIDSLFTGSCWQRCQVHYMRNYIGKLKMSEKGELVPMLKRVFESSDKEEALEKVKELTSKLYEKERDEVAEWLESNIEDTLNVFSIPEKHRKKLRSSNVLERFNRELRRRTRIIGIFPNAKSCERLLTALCQESSEQWEQKMYLRFEVQD